MTARPTPAAPAAILSLAVSRVESRHRRRQPGHASMLATAGGLRAPRASADARRPHRAAAFGAWPLPAADTAEAPVAMVVLQYGRHAGRRAFLRLYQDLLDGYTSAALTLRDGRPAARAPCHFSLYAFESSLHAYCSKPCWRRRHSA